MRSKLVYIRVNVLRVILVAVASEGRRAPTAFQPPVLIWVSTQRRDKSTLQLLDPQGARIISIPPLLYPDRPDLSNKQPSPGCEEDHSHSCFPSELFISRASHCLVGSQHPSFPTELCISSHPSPVISSPAPTTTPPRTLCPIQYCNYKLLLIFHLLLSIY